MLRASQEARTKGVPVVISTRVPSGRVFSLADDRSSAAGLKRLGCVLADNLSPQKARVLLMLALTQMRDPVALQLLFNE